jgi:hypothetical protein
MGIAVAAAVTLMCLLTATSLAQYQPRRPRLDPGPPMQPGIWQKNIAGGQVGPWFADAFGDDLVGDGFRLSGNSTAFHLELFYQPHLKGPLYLDLNFGAISRGDIRATLQTDEGMLSSFGDATLYPLGVGIQWLPLAESKTTMIQPALRVGGSLLIGTERRETLVQTQFYNWLGQTTESRVDLGFYGGAGVFWVLGTQFALTGGVKYQHAKFGKELFGVRDYSGIQVLIGAAYLYF